MWIVAASRQASPKRVVWEEESPQNAFISGFGRLLNYHNHPGIIGCGTSVFVGFWIFQMICHVERWQSMMDLATQPRFENMFQAQTYVVFFISPYYKDFFGFPLYMDLFTNNSKQSRFIQYCTQPSKFHVCFSSNLKPRTLIWRHWRLCWKSESLVIPLSSWSSQKNTSALVLSKKTALTWS